MRAFAGKPTSTQESEWPGSTGHHKSLFARNHSAFSLLSLQRTAASSLIPPSRSVVAENGDALTSTAPTRLLHNFIQIPVYPKAPAGIRVSPGDWYEWAADTGLSTKVRLWRRMSALRGENCCPGRNRRAYAEPCRGAAGPRSREPNAAAQTLHRSE
jgi:hypothetical protein